MRIEDLYKSQISSKIGIAKYRISEATDEELTPHKLMEKGKAILERRPFVFSGISQRAMFVNGSGLFAELESDSKNVKGMNWVQAWLDQRKKMLNQARFMSALNWYAQGNVYFEPSFIDGNTPGRQWLNTLTVIPDSSKIYYNTTAKTKGDFWLYRVEDEMTTIRYKDKVYSIAKYQPYKYSPSTNYFQTTIKAFSLPKGKLIHLRAPYTLDGFYGFSFVMASIDDEEAINKIIRNLIIISSNKAVGKKMISLLDEKGRLVSEEDIQELEEKLDLDAGENVIVNKKIDVKDMASTGTYDTMMGEIDYLTKDIVSGLTPSYMTPWNQSMSLANAQQARLPFIISNEGEKRVFEDFWTEMLIPLLKVEAEDKGISLDGVKITFGETQYFSLEERKDFFLDLYERNVITYNQLLDKLDMEPVTNGDIFYRQMEAKMDTIFGSRGTDRYDPKEFDGQYTSSTPQAFEKALANPKFKEAVTKKPIKDSDKHEYEFDDEEKDTSKKASQQVSEAKNEVLDLITKNVK
jgi:hypothetical protein